MIRIFIYCEGQTEETFVNEILKPSFQTKNLYLYPILLGGGNTYGKIKRQINIKCNQDKTAYITSMIDLYGLPHDFPDFDKINHEKNPIQKVKIAEDAFGHNINQTNFIPNVLLHEFEALLFSDLSKFGIIFNSNDIQNLKNNIDGLNPEAVNNSKETAPSKRILKHFKNYDKPLHGSLIAKKIGLETIREKCPHFNDWLTILENLKHI